ARGCPPRLSSRGGRSTHLSRRAEGPRMTGSLEAGRRSHGTSGRLVALGLALGLGIAPAGVARAQQASHPGQGSGVSITLKKDFIDEFADRATMATDFIVDRTAGRPHPAEADGELHIAGRAARAELATVAELTNPAKASIEFFKRLGQSDQPDTERIVR